jgi:hypothetical protein
MPFAKRVQRPVIGLRSPGQVTEGKIFADALLQPPRTGQTQAIALQPYLQQQRGMVELASRNRIAGMESAQIQTLHNRGNEETKMVRPKNITNTAWKKLSLIGAIRQITRPTYLSYKSAVETKYSHRL